MSSHPGNNFGPLAQLVEQLTFNQLVERSNRSRPTIYKRLISWKKSRGRFFCLSKDLKTLLNLFNVGSILCLARRSNLDSCCFKSRDARNIAAFYCSAVFNPSDFMGFCKELYPLSDFFPWRLNQFWQTDCQRSHIADINMHVTLRRHDALMPEHLL